jgi:signal transduction histidine kinase
MKQQPAVPSAEPAQDDALARERSARRFAEDQCRAKDRFLATVVHELRQPLAPMRAAMDLMKRGESRESGEHARQIVEKQLAQLVRLIEDLMEAARLREGKSQVHMDRTDLRNVVKDAIDAVDPIVQAKRQTVTLVTPDAEAWVNVDAVRMQQVFTNLLSNASKFSAEELPIDITVGLRTTHVQVDVCDQGRGVPSDVLPYIFEMFRQSTAGECGGLGIGLFVVRRVVELHGGTVKARSACPGRGSAFTVRLPRAH